MNPPAGTHIRQDPTPEGPDDHHRDGRAWTRRLGIHERGYRNVGVLDCGSSVEIEFGTTSDADAVAEHGELGLWEDPASEARFTTALRRWQW